MKSLKIKVKKVREIMRGKVSHCSTKPKPTLNLDIEKESH
jgi:hypothetical protein